MSNQGGADRAGMPDRVRASLRVFASPEMLLVASVALMFGTARTMLRPLVAPYALTLGFGPFLAGTVVAVLSVPGFLLAVPAGAVADRWGSTRVLVSSSACVAAGGAALAMVPTLSGLLAAMLVIGLGSLGVALAVHGLATHSVGGAEPDTRRVAASGTFALVGQLIGPVVGGVLTDAIGYEAAFVGVAVIGLLLLCVALAYGRRRPRDPSPPPDDATSLEGPADPAEASGNPYRKARLLLREPGILGTVTVSALASLLLTLRQAFLPVYLTEAGWTASAIGVLLSASAAAAVVSRVAFPAVDRRIGVKALLRTCVLGGAVSLAVAVSTTETALIVAGGLASGILVGSAHPLTLTSLGRLTSPRRRSLALGTRLTANRLSQAAGPLGFGTLAAVSGVRPAFLVLTAAAGLVGMAATRRSG